MPALLTALFCYVAPGLLALTGVWYLLTPEGVWRRVRLEAQTRGLATESEPTVQALNALRRKGLGLLVIAAFIAGSSQFVLAGLR